jgi:hypothetical protein
VKVEEKTGPEPQKSRAAPAPKAVNA